MMFDDGGAPAVEPFGVFIAHVDAAVTHWSPEIVMPVCAMKSYTGGMEEANPGDAGEFVCVRIAGQLSMTHMPGRRLDRNPELPFGGLGRYSVRGRISALNPRRDWRFKHQILSFICP